MIYIVDFDIFGKFFVLFELIFIYLLDGVKVYSMDIGKDEKGIINFVVEFFFVYNGEKIDLKVGLKVLKFGFILK